MDCNTNLNDNQCPGNEINTEMLSVSEPSKLSPVPEAEHENDKVSSLSIIALEYSNSDVEEIEADTNKAEDQNAIPILTEQTSQQYRTINEESILSSCEEIDSEDDSSSTSSSTSSSEDHSSSSRGNNSDDISVNTNNRRNTSTTKKKKSIEDEFCDLPPIEELKISVSKITCDLLGEIDIMEELVLVKPKPDKPTLQTGSVLFLEKGERTLGKILDVFGPVSEPNYVIRFNSAKDIEESNIKVGMSAYYCPNSQYTSLVFLHELNKMKSIDPIGDDEPPTFSDDEEERTYYEAPRPKNKDNADNSVLRKRQCTSSLTQNRPTAECQLTHPRNKNANQRKQQERQQASGNNDYFNPSQYRPTCSYNNPWMQYQYQNNMCWPPARSTYPLLGNESFNDSSLPQHINYNSNNPGNAQQYFQNAISNSQYNNIQFQYPRIPFGAPPRFPFFPNVPFSHINMPYPISARPLMHTNALWSSLSPPPPPSTDSSVND